MDLDGWIAAGNLFVAVAGIVVRLVMRSPATPAHDPWRGHVQERESLTRLLAALGRLRDAADVRVDVLAGDPRGAKEAADALLAAHERARQAARTTSARDIRRVALDAAQLMVGAEGSSAGEAPMKPENLAAHEAIRRAYERAADLIDRRLLELEHLINAGR